MTGYLQVALLPLVPGAGIYDTMRYCVAGETDLFLSTLLHTIGFAAALSVGAMLAATITRSLLCGCGWHRALEKRRTDNFCLSGIFSAK